MYLFVSGVPYADHQRRKATTKCSFEARPSEECKAQPNQEGKKRLRGRVAYDGTNYHGWQFQSNAFTVQGAMERVIQRRFGELIRVVGASRTDTGVHARGQAFHMDVPCSETPAEWTVRDLQKLEHVLNQMLPDDIRMSHLDVAPEYTTFTHCPPCASTSTTSTASGDTETKDNLLLTPSSSSSLIQTAPSSGGTMLQRQHLWSAIYDARGKLYTYRFSTAKTLDPLLRLYCYREWRAYKFGFCEMRMHQAIQRFEGTHDFSAFANASGTKSGSSAAVYVNPVRTIQSIKVVHEDDERYRLEFRIDGALYKMIRNVVGTILDVACFQRPPESIDEMFESKNRRRGSKSAPANGLCLEEVFYEDWPM